MSESKEIAAHLAWLRTSISNVYFAGGARQWVLIDAGVVGYAARIREAAEARFGKPAKPHAIVLTHGHFDHVGCALELANEWRVPVYAHPFEFPYLTGKSAYPQKDPTVGGAMAFLSRFFPAKTVNIRLVLRPLPDDGTVPGLPDWKWIHTPGHAPGHVSFWRENDRALVAGDAVATADLDTWYGLVSQKPRISRPPAPFTYDWFEAYNSVRTLASLKPAVVACGHGEPLAADSSTPVADQLESFIQEFSLPQQGRYAAEPARVGDEGVVFEPPAPKDHLPLLAAGVVAGVFGLASLLRLRNKRKPAAS